MVVAALRTTPLGWPGSELLCTVTLTPTSFMPLPESVVHLWPADELMLAQKLVTILCASFIMLLLPSGDEITEIKIPCYRKKIKHYIALQRRVNDIYIPPPRLSRVGLLVAIR